MRLTSLQAAYEVRFGTDLPSLLRRTIQECGSVRRAAVRLELHRITLHRWCRQMGVNPAEEVVKGRLGKVA